jgi:hypothetical protein
MIEGMLISLNKTSIILNPWEISLFPKDTIVPHEVILDLKNNRLLVVNYTLNVNNCPNYAEGCTVYDKRPIICRMFPCPYADPAEISLSSSVHCSFGLCKAELPPDELHEALGLRQTDGKDGKYSFSTREVRKALFHRYGDQFVLKHQYFMKYIITLADIVNTAEKNGLIKVAKEGIDPEVLRQRIAAAKQVDLITLVPELRELLSEKSLGQLRDALSRI